MCGYPSNSQKKEEADGDRLVTDDIKSVSGLLKGNLEQAQKGFVDITGEGFPPDAPPEAERRLVYKLLPSD